MNIIEIYDLYLKQLEEENFKERYLGKEGYFHASMAGGCLKKLAYGLSGADVQVLPAVTQRLLTLGNIVHRDIQDSLRWYAKNMLAVAEKIDTKVLVEHELIDESLGLRGFADIIFVFTNGQVIIYDVKTIAAYSWTKRFGKDAKPTNGFYEQQLSSYRIMYSKMYNVPLESISGVLLFYKKDSSDMKFVPVESSWNNKAIEYWNAANLIVRNSKVEDFIPLQTEWCPVQSWECSYCPYKHKCNSPLIKEK